MILTKDITRVVITSNNEVLPSEFMIEAPEDFPADVIQNQGKIKKINFFKDDRCIISQLECTFEEKDILSYQIQGEAKIVTKRTVDGERSFVENASFVKTDTAYKGKIRFKIDKDEAIYGLGQQENGVLNNRDIKVNLYQNNMMIPMPVFISSKNYAILFDSNCLMTYQEQDDVITMDFDAVNQIDYYIIYGKNFDEIISNINKLTGKAVMLPKWAFGYVQSKERYKTQDEIIETVDEFELLDIPLSCIVLDWQYWEKGKWGNKIVDKSRFKDFKALTDELHRKDVALMVSVWPNINKGSVDNDEMLEAGKLLGDLSTYDAFDEEARKIYWKQCDRELFSSGADAWWCDSSEPFTPDWNGVKKKTDDERYELAREAMTKFLDARCANAYALVHAKGIYENQIRTNDKKRVANLTRSGWPSMQRYGTILWSGDIKASWDDMKNQIVEGLSISISGIPYWTLDIGAFFVGSDKAWSRWSDNSSVSTPWFWQGDFEEGVMDMGYRELYTRWIQFGTFLPMMRSHGTDTPREPWNFGEPGTKYYDTIVKYIKIRQHLLPYIYSLAAKVTDGGYTMMRSLMFDFADDEAVRYIDDQYMFGPALLVCPVTSPMEYEANNTKISNKQVRSVYMPNCEGWYDFYSGEFFDGGQTTLALAPIEKMPLYVKAGSIIPVEAAKDIVEINIYAGADGEFSFYLDNGIDYRYQDGEYAKVMMNWDDASKTFTLSKVKGDYPTQDSFTLHLHMKDGSIVTNMVSYKAIEVEVCF